MMSEQLFFSKLVTKSLQPIAGNDRFFEGYLTVEVKDKQGEITIVDELIKVLPIWMDRGAPITDTHSNRVIGKGINYQKTIYKAVDGKEYPAIKIIGKIHSNYELDNEIWKRITTGDYKGLSFGGATKSARTPFRMKDGTIAYSLKDLEHYEVAVCRDPAVPLALITDFNHIAKAMTDNYTTHSEGKMLIRCSNFGCFVEKKEDKKEEVELTKEGKIVSDEAEKYSRLEMYKGGFERGCTNNDCNYKQIGRDQKTPPHKFCPECGTNMEIGDLKKDSLVKIEDEKDKNTKVEVLDEWENETNPKDDKDEDSKKKSTPEEFAKKERKEISSKKLGSAKDVDNSLLHNRTDEQPFVKANLNESQTFEEKVQALIAEGKSRESAEKIVGSFVHKEGDGNTATGGLVGDSTGVNPYENKDSQQVTPKKKKTIKSYKSAENYINLLIKDLHKDMVEEDKSKKESSYEDEEDKDKDDKESEEKAKSSFRESIKSNFEAMTEVIQSLAETQKSVSESLKSVDTRLKALETPTDLPLKPKESDSEDIGAKVKIPDVYQSNSVQADLHADGEGHGTDKNSLSMQEKTHTTGTPRPNAGIENVNKTFGQDYNPILKDARESGDLSQVARNILSGKYYTPEQEAWY